MSLGGHEVAERVRASFARQGLMRLLGAEVVGVGDGTCVIEVPFAEGITQQELLPRGCHGCHSRHRRRVRGDDARRPTARCSRSSTR